MSRPAPRQSVDLRAGSNPAGLVIPVTSGVGEGPTEIAAFDAALLDAGVGNMNLIRLSSVIPTGATIEVRVDDLPDPGATTESWGHRLYVVYADARVSRPGEVAAACVGWVQNEATGDGLFVEIDGHDEERVRGEVEASLLSMAASRSLHTGPVTLLSRSIRCDDQPVCSIVIATFVAEGWT